MFMLVSTQVVESSIFATATIDRSCDERLDVEKRFPSLVSVWNKGIFLIHLVQLVVSSDALDITRLRYTYSHIYRHTGTNNITGDTYKPIRGNAIVG